MKDPEFYAERARQHAAQQQAHLDRAYDELHTQTLSTRLNIGPYDDAADRLVDQLRSLGVQAHLDRHRAVADGQVSTRTVVVALTRPVATPEWLRTLGTRLSRQPASADDAGATIRTALQGATPHRDPEHTQAVASAHGAGSATREQLDDALANFDKP